MHTLVFWAAVLSSIPLVAGIALEVLRRLRDAMMPPALDLPPTATPRAPQSAVLGPGPPAPR